MTIPMACALATAILVTGCGRHPATAVDPAGAASKPGGSGGGTGLVDTASGSDTAGSVPVNQAELDAALEGLSQALRKYSFEHRRVPKSFAELVEAGYANEAMPAPPGKAFAINSAAMRVVLVNK